MTAPTIPRYDPCQTYEWNYEHAPDPPRVEVPSLAGEWHFCGRRIGSPLGIPAGPLLNGRWCLYYAHLGFDVLTYKTVRSRERACYPLPNLQPVDTVPLQGGESSVRVASAMQGSWAVSFGMPSRSPEVWRADVEATRRQLPAEKLLVVSVVGTVQPGWGVTELADDYAQCGRWAVEAGANAVEANLSCPNVATQDGQLYQCPADARIVAERIREVIGAIPLVLKIGHVRSREQADELVAAVDGIANGLSMVNCIAVHVIDDGKNMLFDGGLRGIGGEAIRAASLDQIAMFRTLVRRRNAHLDLIGVGGISTAGHVASYLDHGANHVQLATSIMLDPFTGIRILKQLGLPGRTAC